MRTLAGRMRALPSRPRAIFLILLAVFFFSALEATAKYLSQFYSVFEVVWLRYTVHTLVMLVLIAPRMGLKLLATENLTGQLLRALLLMGSTLCNVGALSRLPLAEVKAISYAQLLWVILWGWLIFGQLPDAHAYIGMAIISASGLYVALGHKFRRREEPETALD